MSQEKVRRAPTIKRFTGPWIAVTPVVAYLAFFFLIPFGYVLAVSFFSVTPTGAIIPDASLDNYRRIFSSSTSFSAYWRSIYVTFWAVFLGTIFGYATAYTLAFHVSMRVRYFLLLAIILPFWTSFIIRAFSWQLFLSEGGPLASILRDVGIIEATLGIAGTHIATTIALGLFAAMIVIITVFSLLDGMEKNILEAAKDLGGNEWQTFVGVILPLSTPGLSLGIALSVIIVFGDYVAPTLLGAGMNLLLPQLLVQSLQEVYNVPLAAAYAVLLFGTIVLIAMPIMYIGRKATSGS